MAVDVTVPVNVIVGVAVHPNTEEQNKDADLVLLSVELIAFKQFDTLGTAVQVGCAAYVNDDKTPRIVQSSNVKVIDIRPLILQLVKGNNVISLTGIIIAYEEMGSSRVKKKKSIACPNISLKSSC